MEKIRIENQYDNVVSLPKDEIIAEESAMRKFTGYNKEEELSFRPVN